LKSDKLKTSVEGDSEMPIENCPFMSVTVPKEVPLIITFTPGMGLLSSALRIVPCTFPFTALLEYMRKVLDCGVTGWQLSGGLWSHACEAVSGG
jgi:hypothetical protein